MVEQLALTNGRHRVAAGDWFPRVADELEMLEAGEPSWRTDAATRLRTLADRRQDLSPDDGELLALIALELVGEEDQAALDQGLVTWRSLAADELADLAEALSPEGH
jgi:hypothetical protein